jgi:hypothetical protein
VLLERINRARLATRTNRLGGGPLFLLGLGGFLDFLLAGFPFGALLGVNGQFGIEAGLFGSGGGFKAGGLGGGCGFLAGALALGFLNLALSADGLGAGATLRFVVDQRFRLDHGLGLEFFE